MKLMRAWDDAVSGRCSNEKRLLYFHTLSHHRKVIKIAIYQPSAYFDADTEQQVLDCAALRCVVAGPPRERKYLSHNSAFLALHTMIDFRNSSLFRTFENNKTRCFCVHVRGFSSVVNNNFSRRWTRRRSDHHHHDEIPKQKLLDAGQGTRGRRGNTRGMNPNLRAINSPRAREGARTDGDLERSPGRFLGAFKIFAFSWHLSGTISVPGFWDPDSAVAASG